MIDPLALPSLNPYQLPTLPRRAPGLPPLTPEEEADWLERIGSGALSGLGAIAGALNKPGRAVRGLLGGQPREMLNLIPFSDALGITDPGQEVTGADLTGNTDAAFFSPEGLANFGTEILTDPLTYLTLGGSALTKAGRVAKSAGVLPSATGARAAGTLGEALLAAENAQQASRAGSAVLRGTKPVSFMDQARLAAEKLGTPLDSLLGEHMGGVAGFRLPFMGEPFGVFGKGQTGKAIADATSAAAGWVGGLPGIKQAGEMLAPMGRSLKAAFIPKYMDQTERELQAVMPGVFKSTEEGAVAAKQRFADIVQEAKQFGLTGQEGGDQIRGLLEGTWDKPKAPGAESIAGKLKQLKDDVYADHLHWGGSPTELKDDFAEHFMRQMRMDPSKASGGARRTALATQNMSELGGREPILKNIPGGTVGNSQGPGVNAMIRDAERLSQMEPLAAAAEIRSKYLGVQNEDAVWELAKRSGIKEEALFGFGEIPLPPSLDEAEKATLQAFRDRYKQSVGLADYLRTTVPRLGAEGFTYHPAADGITYALAHNAQTNGYKGVYQIIKDNAIPGQAGVRGPDTVNVLKLLDDAGIKGDARIARLAEIGVKDPHSTFVPYEVYNMTTKMMQGINSPEATKPIVEAWDYMTRLFKGHITSYYPAFHVRNAMSNLWQSFVDGSLSKDALKQAHAVLGNDGVIAGLSKNAFFKSQGMDDAAATKWFRSYAHANGLAGEARSVQAGEILGDIGSEITSKIPGLEPFKLKSDRGSWNLLHVGQGDDEKVFHGIATGQVIGKRIEETSRLGSALSLLDQGVAPEMAAARVKAAMVDYGALTSFEKTWMRRIAPFYCVPDDCEILTKRGWMKVDDLVVGEAVLSMDHDTGKSYWVPCEDKHTYDYNGILMAIRTERDWFSFTPNHKWPVVFTTTRHKKSLKGARKIVEGWRLRENAKIPRVANYSEEHSVATPREAAIIGWIVTDGYQRTRERNPNYTEVLIYQSPHKYLQEILELLGDDGSAGKPHPDSGVVPVRLHAGQLKDRLLGLCPSKEHFINFVTGLNREAARELVLAMLKAEGCLASGDTWCFSQNQGPILDGFQIACQLAGITAHISGNGKECKTIYCSRATRSHKKIRCSELTTESYKGRVWCPQTKFGTWLMRRNGRIIWTGNSWSRGNLPFQLQQLVERPGGIVGTTIKGLDAAKGEHPGFLPDYLNAGGSPIPIGQQTDGTQRFISQLGLPFENLGEMIQGRGWLGALSPGIKIPLETATGRQFYSGRDLRDLYSRTGVPILDEVLMNSPAARALSTAGSTPLSDPRKTWLDWLGRVGSGVRATDVDMTKAKDVAIREFLEGQLHGPEIRRFQRMYVKPEDLMLLSPQEQELYRLYQSRERAAMQTARAR